MAASPENTPARPAPDDYDDFRAYLRAMIVHLKATRPQFSYRYFSRMAGFSSPNFLKLVAEGKRNISARSIPKFARGLGLDPQEQDTFQMLVMLGQATTDVERNRFYSQLRRRTAGDVSSARLEDAQYRVYSLWYALPIREMVSHPDFVEDPAWIGRRLYPTVRSADVQSALELLEETGLVVRDEQGKLRPAKAKLSTGPRVRSLAVRNFHRSMLELTIRGLESVSSEERDVTALTVSLTRAQFEQVRGRVAEFRQDLFDFIEAEQSDPDSAETEREVYQVGFQIVPLSGRPPSSSD